ncbi:pectinesterase family protein [Hydrotalea sp.]|uniref:pectinesterase family protein n=1 Tax=Hydrotalea sp. TaxID=2881279 RepID=UPI003D0A3F4C
MGKVSIKYFILLIILCGTHNNLLFAEAVDTLHVSKTKPHCFKNIQLAINAIDSSNHHKHVILIDSGTYKEKIYITKNNIHFLGEDKTTTIITQAIARDIWRCKNTDDWGVATVNISGNDITIENVTIQNTYGFENNTKVVPCENDSLNNFSKTIRKDGHQMALRTFATTCLKVLNCILKAYGGDTVSPWNVNDGMFFFKDCLMMGGVDFYCPRGWAYAENCTFVATTGPACIWHDGSGNEDAKTVLKNCFFQGYDGFMLGRFHKDAQFYLINCSFAKNMANKPIYLVPTNNIIRWGYRVYYYNCHKAGGDYSWFKNNLETAKGSPLPDAINANWVFGNKWNPYLN